MADLSPGMGAELDELACELYIDWSRPWATEETSRRRWGLMPDFGKRPFLSLARVATRHLAPKPAGAAERAALRSAEARPCPCGAMSCMLNAAGLCMACASREAE